MFGTWSVHDGSKFVGKFQNNLPGGNGLFVFASGNKSSGRFVDGKWQSDAYPVQTVTDTPPKSIPVDPFKQAIRAIDKCVLKRDHTSDSYMKKKEIDGAPNYRRVADFPVFGTAQPSIPGLLSILNVISDAGLDSKVIWINLRKEPVIYVNDFSYVPRDKHDMNNELNVEQMSSGQLNELEIRLASNTKAAV
jgi:hypothetical protein